MRTSWPAARKVSPMIGDTFSSRRSRKASLCRDWVCDKSAGVVDSGRDLGLCQVRVFLDNVANRRPSASRVRISSTVMRVPSITGLPSMILDQ